MTSPEAFEQTLSAQLTAQSVSPGPETGILVGYSGGPDSTALLHALAALRPSWSFQLEAFHLDHGLRPAAERAAEQTLITTHCHSLGIPLHRKQLAPGYLQQAAREAGRSIEMIAREWRHRLLNEWAKEQGLSFIALAHTRDDNLETLVMRFFQGSGSGGLGGIPPTRGRIIRPLLVCSKREILAYLEACGLAFSRDSTNQADTYLRNRVRHHLLPLCGEIFPGYGKSLASFAWKMRDIHDFLDRSLDEQLRLEDCGGGKYRVDLKAYNRLHRSLKLHLIYRAFNLILPQNSGNLPFRFLKPVLERELEARDRITGYGLAIEAAEESLFFQSDIVSPKKKGYLIENNGTNGIRIHNSGLNIKIIEKIGEKGMENSTRNPVLLKKGLVHPPLIIRSCRMGDKIKLKGLSKSLKKLWNEWGVPVEMRNRIPVLADRSGILAVAGRPFGYKNLVTMAHCRIKKGEEMFFIKIEEDGVKQSGQSE